MGGNNFPHAFVRLEGQPQAGGATVDVTYGFTAKALSPAILMGSVGGKVINETPSYLANGDRQFSLALTDAAYARVLETVKRWRDKPQPSYNLNRSNCVHFVGEVAQAAGLRVTFEPKLMKKPRSFLLSVRRANPELGASPD
jgi:hypothetical protein